MAAARGSPTVLVLAAGQGKRLRSKRIKLLHAVAYLVLGTLSLRAAHGGLGELRVWPTLLGLLLTLVYGVVDEWHQAWVPARHSSGLDFLADAVGAGLSVPVAGLLGGLGRNRARRLGKQG